MPLSRDVLSGLGERLHEHAGLDLPAWVIEARALTRIGALGLSQTAYLELVNSPGGEGELGSLVEAVRVGETSFFRHRPQVDALLSVVVPSLRDRGCLSPRVWSAGCATGEEPYTLALVLARALPRPAFSPSILATDVSAEALSLAERALYPESALSDVPPEYREGFTPAGDGVRVRPEIANLVRFRRQNLADADAPRGFELVWCRNVLIYFGPEARRRVLERLVSALVPGGFLFLGYSETLRDADGLQPVRFGDQVLWQRPLTPSSPSREALVKPRFVATERASLRPATSLARTALRRETAAPARVLVSREAPSSSSLVSREAPSARGLVSREAPSVRGPVSREVPSVRAATSGREIVVRLTDPEAKDLGSEIRAALATPGVRALVIDLDAAEILEDAAAPLLRRALAAAEPLGVAVRLRAARPGTQRWLRRNGLGGGES